MKFETETFAEIPMNRKRSKLGVAEFTDIIVTPKGAGNITWTMANQLNSFLDESGDNNYNPSFQAATSACNPEVKADFGNGISKTLNFQVVQPSSEVATKTRNLTLSEMRSTAINQQGVGMLLNVTVFPNDVSFKDIQVLEVAGGASNPQGYFLQPNINNLGSTYHNPNPNWEPLDEYNQWPDYAAFFQWSAPWQSGSYTWDIPVRWRVNSSSPVRTSIPNRIQVHRILGVDGTSKEEKLGQSATRTPGQNP
jgi:hypothetical protein